MASADELRWSEMVRRVDGLVQSMAAEHTYGKALYREFQQHCRDDETRHAENVASLKEIEQKRNERAAALDAGFAKQALALNDMANSLNAVLPWMRRRRAREVFWHSVIRCLSRWRAALVGLGVSAAAVYVWIDGHWPRIAALLRKIGGGN